MTEVKRQVSPKKAWYTPVLTVYGTVEDLTQQTGKCKIGGLGDDLVSQISTIPGRC